MQLLLLNHIAGHGGKAPTDGLPKFENMDKKGNRHVLTYLDIQKPWAFAGVTPRSQKKADVFLPDGSGFLLHKEKTGWKVKCMGTEFTGVGDEFGVPKGLWNKWNLN